MRASTSTGALVAAMAAGLFTTGVAVTTQAADTDKVQCHGINACKGKGACHTKEHACGGKNSCKGKGWLLTTEKDCKAKGGRSQPLTPMPASESKK